jgi:hypothetical protein
MTIRSADESWAVEKSAHILEVNSMVLQVDITLLRIPSEIANAREEPPCVFRHSEVPQTRSGHGSIVEDSL